MIGYIIVLVIALGIVGWFLKKDPGKSTNKKQPAKSNNCKKINVLNKEIDIVVREKHQHKNKSKSDTLEKTSSKVTVAFSKIPLSFVYNYEALSRLPNDYQVVGSTGSIYSINFATLTCSCPDSIERRSNYPAYDMRRLCKHQVRALVELHTEKELTQDNMMLTFLKAAAGDGKGIRLYKEIYEIRIEEQIKGPNPFYVLIPEDQYYPWAQILFFLDNFHINYRGYHLEERRWGYHENPFPSGSRRKYNWIMAKIADQNLEMR